MVIAAKVQTRGRDQITLVHLARSVHRDVSDAVWIVSYFARIPSFVNLFRCQQRASCSANSDRYLQPTGSFFSSSIKVSTEAIGDAAGLKRGSVDEFYCQYFRIEG